MRKLFTSFALLGTLALTLAGCNQTTGAISFSSIVAAIQKDCSIVIDVSQQPIVAAIVQANPLLTTADLIATTVCAAASTIPNTGHKNKEGKTSIVIPVNAGGHTFYVTGTRE